MLCRATVNLADCKAGKVADFPLNERTTILIMRKVLVPVDGFTVAAAPAPPLMADRKRGDDDVRLLEALDHEPVEPAPGG